MSSDPKQTTNHMPFKVEFARCWKQIPNKGIFFMLLVAWLALFHFLGNATFGYIETSSLMRWMARAYWSPADAAPDHWSLNYFLNGFTDDGHGFLIPIVILVLLWMRRDLWLKLVGDVWWPGLLLVAGALFLHMVGYLVQQPRISIVGFFAGIYALTGLVWGPAWMRATFFPFVLFAFCIPVTSIGEPITFPLRNFVAKVVGIISNEVLGMPVVREGTQLFNSAHTYRYEVAAACSGLRSLIAIIAIGTIYGCMSFESGWKRLIVVLSAFPLAIIGNVLRMLSIIIAAEISGQAAGNYVHESPIFSMIPYIPAVIGLMLIGRWLRGRRIEPALPLEVKPV